MNEKRHESTEDFFGGMFGKQSFHIPDVKSSFSTFGSSLKDTGIDYSDQEENDSSLANTSESPLIHIEEAMMEPTTIPPPGADVIRTDEIDGDVASSESARGGNSDNCARYTVGENTPKIVARCIFNEEVYPEVDIQPNQQQIIPYGNLTVVSGSDKSAQSTISISLDLPGGQRYSIDINGVSLLPVKLDTSVQRMLKEQVKDHMSWTEKKCYGLGEIQYDSDEEELTRLYDSDDSGDDIPEITDKEKDISWVCCDRCSKWRRLPDGYIVENVEKWYCEMNSDTKFSYCSVPQEPEMKRNPAFIGDVCGVCHIGGSASDFVCCLGPCLRMFHKDCIKLMEQTVWEGEWFCDDCVNGNHVCFYCKEGGASEGSKSNSNSSGNSNGKNSEKGATRTYNADLVKCPDVCGKYYHSTCLAKANAMVPSALNHGKRIQKSQRSHNPNSKYMWGKRKPCGLHWCHTCGEEETDKFLLRCTKCPRAYHQDRACQPKDIRLLSRRAFVCNEHERKKIGKDKNGKASSKGPAKRAPKEYRGKKPLHWLAPALVPQTMLPDLSANANAVMEKCRMLPVHKQVRLMERMERLGKRMQQLTRIRQKRKAEKVAEEKEKRASSLSSLSSSSSTSSAAAAEEECMPMDSGEENPLDGKPVVYTDDMLGASTRVSNGSTVKVGKGEAGEGCNMNINADINEQESDSGHSMHATGNGKTSASASLLEASRTGAALSSNLASGEIDDRHEEQEEQEEQEQKEEKGKEEEEEKEEYTACNTRALKEMSRSLPLKVSSKLTVLSLGRIVHHRVGFHSPSYIYPAGFKSIRQFRSPHDERKITSYINEVLDEGEHAPVFRVTCVEEPDMPVTGNTPSDVWLQVYQRHYPHRCLAVNGHQLFGFRSPTVRALIERLPGSDTFRDYLSFRTLVTMDGEEASDLDGNSGDWHMGDGSGRGRLEKIGRKRKRQHSQLPSPRSVARGRGKSGDKQRTTMDVGMDGGADNGDGTSENKRRNDAKMNGNEGEEVNERAQLMTKRQAARDRRAERASKRLEKEKKREAERKAAAAKKNAEEGDEQDGNAMEIEAGADAEAEAGAEAGAEAEAEAEAGAEAGAEAEAEAEAGAGAGAAAGGDSVDPSGAIAVEDEGQEEDNDNNHSTRKHNGNRSRNGRNGSRTYITVPTLPTSTTSSSSDSDVTLKVVRTKYEPSLPKD